MEARELACMLRHSFIMQIYAGAMDHSFAQLAFNPAKKRFHYRELLPGGWNILSKIAARKAQQVYRGTKTVDVKKIPPPSGFRLNLLNDWWVDAGREWDSYPFILFFYFILFCFVFT